MMTESTRHTHASGHCPSGSAEHPRSLVAAVRLGLGTIPDRAISALLFVLTLAIGIMGSQVRDLNGDEHWTRLLSHLPLAESLPFIIQDGKHPPGYILLQMLGAVVVPDTALGLRAISLLAIALVPVVVYRLARSLSVTRLEALLLVSWLVSHPALLDQASNARSYALLALFVALYSSMLVRWTLAPASGSRLVAPMALLAVLASLVHAFGVLFILSLSFVSLVYLWRTTPSGLSWDRGGAARALVRAHVPAMALSALWFIGIAIVTRDLGGIESGLAWLTYPENSERLYTFGFLLGNPGFPKGTTLYLCFWGLVLFTLSQGSSPRTGVAAYGRLVLAAGIAPFLAQLLASGIVTELPLWGARHVTPSPILLMVGVVVAVSAMSRQGRARPVLVALFGVMAVIAVLGGRARPTNSLSRFAKMILTSGDSTPIRVLDQYGNLSTLNYYLDRRCLDTRQLRVQFPQVLGPPSQVNVGGHCRAEALEPDRLPSGSRFFLVHREFVPEEVAARRRLLEAGWSIVGPPVTPGEPTEPVIEILEQPKS